MRATAISSERGGFTLLEVMIAMAIVAIAMVALLSLGNRSIRIGDHLQQITRATLLAQSKMSEVEVLAQQGQEDFLGEEGRFDKPFANYRWRTTFTDTPFPAVTRVTVIVAWGEEARNESVDLTSYLFR